MRSVAQMATREEDISTGLLQTNIPMAPRPTNANVSFLRLEMEKAR